MVMAGRCSSKGRVCKFYFLFASCFSAVFLFWWAGGVGGWLEKGGRIRETPKYGSGGGRVGRTSHAVTFVLISLLPFLRWAPFPYLYLTATLLDIFSQTA